ncbi:MAG: hypothetical protein K2Z80_21855 [Xanthobacteraceae bacterium]|nr:hypothetical protein [Xanthobacteraceae bacterium]
MIATTSEPIEPDFFEGISSMKVRLHQLMIAMLATVGTANANPRMGGSVYVPPPPPPRISAPPRVYVAPPSIDVRSAVPTSVNTSTTSINSANTASTNNSWSGGNSTWSSHTSNTAATSAPPAPTFSEVTWPMVQNTIAALPPQNAFAPGTAMWNANNGTVTFSPQGAAIVVGGIVVGGVVNSYMPTWTGRPLSPEDQRALALTTTLIVTAPAGVPSALVATYGANLTMSVSDRIETNFRGDDPASVVTRGVLTGATAGGVAATGAQVLFWIGATSTAPATGTIALAVGGATAAAYVIRPAVGAAVDAASNFYNDTVANVTQHLNNMYSPGTQ